MLPAREPGKMLLSYRCDGLKNHPVFQKNPGVPNGLTPNPSKRLAAICPQYRTWGKLRLTRGGGIG